MKIALVTGGSRGIGKAVCLKLAAMGYYIIINYRSNTAEAENTLNEVKQLGSDGELLPFDVSDRADIRKSLSEWKKRNSDKYIEVLVNNAGIRKDNILPMMEDNEWDDVINTNLHSFFNVTRELTTDMLMNKYGRIINIVSLSGLKGMSGQTNYSAAKAGVIGATKALAQEIAKKKVTVNAVAPGFIKTDMTEDLDEKMLKRMIPANRFGKPEEVAAVVGFLASEGASYITGEVISVNGGLYT